MSIFMAELWNKRYIETATVIENVNSYKVAWVENVVVHM